MAKSKKSASRNRRADRAYESQNISASEVYRDLISEVVSSSGTVEATRPLKRRRTAAVEHRHGADQELIIADTRMNDFYTYTGATPQVIIDDANSSDGSDLDWQEVELGEDLIITTPPNQDESINDVEILLDQEDRKNSKSTIVKRKNITLVERKVRQDIHKVHILCHFAHVHLRNTWCNDEQVQLLLRPRLSRRTVSYLNPDKNLSQFQRSRSFMDGLQQAIDVWKLSFTITSHGLRKPQWSPELIEHPDFVVSEDLEQPMDKSGFREAAMILEGSRDTGAQLFCALLRSVGLDARLVCSLQTLSFNSGPLSSPSRTTKTTVYYPASGSDIQDSTTEEGDETSGPTKPVSKNESIGTTGVKRIKRFGQSRMLSETKLDLGKPPPLPKKRKKIVDSPYPVYWIEAFNAALQKWIPVDPITTMSISKPSKLEPPQTQLYDMSYVIAFEDDYTAKDVTKRYTRAYNAKTRRNRVESIKGGASWWKRTLKTFDSGLIADRDQVEAAELAQKEASEPMPRNAQDFKNHPHYALERHLRHDEIIHPKREVGKFTAGKHSAGGVESIFRRRDVQTVKSADKWFRSGREVKAGEQPLKYGKPRRGNPETSDVEDNDNGVGLYADFQTDLYIPPPVSNGQIPKNMFGNLDIYVASMIPSGGAHIRVPDAAKAARLIGVDYSDAVVGFEFKGRRGTAIMKGAVVAAEYVEAIVAVIENLWEAQDEADAQKRSRESLKLWKRFMIGLRIRERVMRDASDDEMNEQLNRFEDSDGNSNERDEFQDGGFLPSIIEATEQPTGKDHQKGRIGNDPREIVKTVGDISPHPHYTVLRRVPPSAIIYPPTLNPESWSPEFQETSKSNTIITPMKTANISDVDMSDQEGGFLHETNSDPEPSPREQRGPKIQAVEPTAGEALAETVHDTMPVATSSQLTVPESQGQAMDVEVAGVKSASVGAVSEVAVSELGLDVTMDEFAGGESGSDSASLLSHDPEDDDAEPEWLADETEL